MQWALVFAVAASPLMVSGPALAQSYSEPEDDHLHEVVQAWAGKSTLGNLRALAFPDDDVELRIWSGFGLLGATGYSLRRQNGTWSVSTIAIDRYIAGATVEIAAREGLLPPCIVDQMESRCTIETTDDAQGNPLEYSLNCVQVLPDAPRATQADMEELWDTLREMGLLSLPPKVERNRDWVSTGGHYYVIEVRVGNDYRATVLDHSNDDPVDDQVHQILGVFDATMGIDTLYRGYTHD